MSLNDIIIKNIKLTLSEISLFKALNIFYNDINNTDLLKNILFNNEIRVSIRLIDYYITKYSKLNKISYLINNNIFNVYISYKQQLKIYQKKYFDPFSRGIRIPYFFYNNTAIITTLGQLNFFKWFIEKDVLKNIKENIIDIENNMNINNKILKYNKKSNIKNKKKNNIVKIDNTNINTNTNTYTNTNTNNLIVVSFSFYNNQNI
jgi:hypothetical protein